jgi:hypothetical protein
MSAGNLIYNPTTGHLICSSTSGHLISDVDAVDNWYFRFAYATSIAPLLAPGGWYPGLLVILRWFWWTYPIGWDPDSLIADPGPSYLFIGSSRTTDLRDYLVISQCKRYSTGADVGRTVTAINMIIAEYDMSSGGAPIFFVATADCPLLPTTRPSVGSFESTWTESSVGAKSHAVSFVARKYIFIGGYVTLGNWPDHVLITPASITWTYA